MSDGSVPGQKPRLIDSTALSRITGRLQSAPQPPWLHAEVGRRMLERLPIIRMQPARVLDWWSFSGASTQGLRNAYPAAELLRLEPEPSIGAIARGRQVRAAPWWSLQRWRGANAAPVSESRLQPGKAQLVWANMGLHFWPDPVMAFKRWHRALAVDGFLMFSTCGPGTLTLLQALYTRAGWPPPFAPFVDMHDLGDMLIEAGFADPVMDQEQLTLTWPTARAALDELRQLGGNAHPLRMHGLRTPRWRAQLLDELASVCGAVQGTERRVALTFEVVYGHAFKPLPRARVTPRTQVSLEDLKLMAKTPRPRQ
jgi:malonyl-CoA O-methyltransferase